MPRVYNFSAGPSMLPEPVLRRAAQEMLNYKGSGQSVMEMSHRSPVYQDILETTEALLREVMQIPDSYHVLFLQGEASSQFAMVPMNLMTQNKKADYILTGQWAEKAQKEAARYGEAKIIASSREKQYACIPDLAAGSFSPDADYCHICLNNTIYGTRFSRLPSTGDVPLVADISSCILSAPLDVSSFGLLYAGAQKNLAPAGLTVVILRKDLVGQPMEQTPTMFQYHIHIKNHSMYNTPPCYCIYIAMLVLKWLKEDMGGLASIERINRKKASLLYDFLDQSSLFHGTACKQDRSFTNIPFVTGSQVLDAEFLESEEHTGLINLKGHRSVGGMRASLYNAMPEQGVAALVEHMDQFERKHR